MKNSVKYKKELEAIKELIFTQINSHMSSKDFELVTVEDLEDGDYEQNHLTLRNDNGEVYDVLIVGVKNGKLLTYNEYKEDYEFDITPLGDIDSTDDLISLLGLLEENYEEEMTKKKDEIEKILIRLITSLNIDIPDNYEDIVQYVFEDVCETADTDNWHEGDVAIGFRRWIESK